MWRVLALWVHAVGAHNRRDGLPVFLDELIERERTPAHVRARLVRRPMQTPSYSRVLPASDVVAVPVRDGIAFGTESGIGIGIEIDTESGISHFWARDAFSNE